MPQRSATNSVWPGCGEADRVELFLGDRAGDDRRRRARSGRGRPQARANRASNARRRRSDGRECRPRPPEPGSAAARRRTPNRPRAGRRSPRSARPTPPRASARRRSRRRAAGRTSPRLSQHLAMTSGPIPAGSPSETASGWDRDGRHGAAPNRNSGLAEFDHRVAAKIAQIAPRARVHPLFVELVVDLVVGRLARARPRRGRRSPARERLPRASRTAGSPGRPASAASSAEAPAAGRAS